MKTNNFQIKVYVLSVGFFIFLILVSIISLNIVKHKLLENSRVMGQTIAGKFAERELAKIRAQRVLLDGAVSGLDQMSKIHPQRSKEEMVQALEAYTKDLNDAAGLSHFDMCAIIDGTLIGTRPWQQNVEFKNLKWYYDALESNDGVIYTDLYRYGRDKTRVLTIAKRIGTSRDVVAVNIYPQLLDTRLPENSLPENSVYYLCDTKGHLLYSLGRKEKSLESLQPHVEHIVSEIKQNFLHGNNLYIYDLEGKQRAVYYTRADNGWVSIITMPYEYILKDYQGLLWWYLVTLATFICAAALLYWRGQKLYNQVETMHKTLSALGNSYYAIYKVNYEKGFYQKIRGSKLSGVNVPLTGSYDALMVAVLQVIEKDAASDFARNFSIEHIRKLVDDNVTDFGGDFKQKFVDGYKWANVRLLFDKSLSSGEVLLCCKLVDEEKRMQLEHIRFTESALESIQKTTESKNMFFSSMSHDMRTPLNGIIGLSELAGKHVDEPDKMREYLQKINTSSKQLLALINDILEMSKLEHGKLETNEELFDIRNALVDSLSSFNELATVEHKTFNVKMDIVHDYVCGDFTRINQILNNIISNSFKYTPEGGEISLTVKEIPGKDTTQFQFMVCDNGFGMSEEFLQKIFTPFERDMRFSAKKAMGTGLGMTIVKNLITQMNGDIHIKSKLQEGTCITITLPLSLQGMCKDCSKACKMPAAKVQKTDDKHYDLNGYKVMIAEDNEINMEIATELLQLKGIEVVQAWNGKEALEKFQLSAPGEIDVILMDMQMPEMNGCEAAMAIRSLPRADAQEVPIIAVTANAFAEDITATTAAGMNAHISKPINFTVLEKTIGELLKDKL